jgi:hypothetical protein
MKTFGVLEAVNHTLGMTKYEDGLLRPESAAECFKGYRLANTK